jgi:hypothetical protein
MSDELGTPTVNADDLLLDALGRGELPSGSDEITAMLAAWRADLQPDPDADETADETAGNDSEPAVTVVTPLPTRRVRRWSRIAVAAAAAIVAGGGLTVAAASGAGPDSPLWPITRVVFPERADVAAAEHAIDQAREAVVQGRIADARRLIDEADKLIAKVRSPQDAKRLRTELDEVRRQLDVTVRNGTLPPPPDVTPAPGLSGSPAPGGAGPGTGNPGGQSGGGIPGVPGLPLPTGSGGGLPSLPVPTPSLPLPSLPLPSLPLPIPGH